MTDDDDRPPLPDTPDIELIRGRTPRKRTAGKRKVAKAAKAAKKKAKKKRTGKTSRGTSLPPEKPLTAIGADEIGRYKDMFVLSDRALLMMDDLRRRMGREDFDAFCRDIFNRHSLDLVGFREAVLTRLPGDAERLRVWLETNDYPEELQWR